ncbi:MULTISPECIES: YbaK/EbsC family protein [Streptomyces]|uniref:YbaK/aminoacyl-tRNA synthetase-associated domain-containing protein n=1 Tax=Streptomyces lycii TaxID=2654337 RepID=A0ABQ7FL05_9ACTN|nr:MULTISPECIES: YbaK/EbsC family protein [Streptomyces]KAF4408456.1 hypothetical protein GCU69_14150 [Streptomyces lycii]PGH51689.1 hypothetical protein CRI70_05190 [Streptomyces sp. Ru87]
MRAPIGNFGEARPAADCLDELCPPVAAAVRAWEGAVPPEDALYVDTDPDKADTAVLAEAYGPGILEASANCVVVAGRRGGATTLAACVVLSTTRLDVNGTVRRHLAARKASFAPMDTAVGETGMEYGGITPIGLPADWPLLIDPAVVDRPYLVIGSGRRRGKLIVTGKVLAGLPGATLLDGLAS